MDGPSLSSPPTTQAPFILSLMVLALGAPVLAEAPVAAPRVTHVMTRPDGVRIEVSLAGEDRAEARLLEALQAAVQELKDGSVTPVAAAPTMPSPPEPRRELPPIIPEEVIPGEPVWGDPLDQPWHLTYLPSTLLWQPPLAQPGQPRTYILYSSAEESYTSETIDTAIGGTFALLRYGPQDGCRHAVQADFFAVVFSRFAHHSRLNAADYRFGYPLTFAWGPWEGKLGYEHTSTHIGDEYLEVAPDFRKEVIRDELVCALGYRFLDQFRVYGQLAYSLDLRSPGEEDRRGRYNLGVEWYRQEKSPWYGQPFAAVDADIRGDQDYRLNLTAQVGLMWRDPARRPFFRILLEYYDGRSPYGHFTDQNESWIAGGVAMDY